jgi:hypothetical protein
LRMKEKDFKLGIAKILTDASIPFARESKVPGFQVDARFDFAVVDRIPRAVIEVKRSALAHAMLTAMGQCVLYARCFRIPTSQAIICVPRPERVAPMIADAAASIGIQILADNQLVAAIEKMAPGMGRGKIQDFL